jgi:hypothetical protein
MAEILNHAITVRDALYVAWASLGLVGCVAAFRQTVGKRITATNVEPCDDASNFDLGFDREFLQNPVYKPDPRADH